MVAVYVSKILIILLVLIELIQIFWTGNTASLGRARAGIIGVTASNNDATHIAFLTRTAANGTGFYPSDERMRIDNTGKVFI